LSTKKIQIIGSLGSGGNKIYTQNDEPTNAADGTLWVDLDAEGGAENGGVSVSIDTTLTQSGKAADAKAVGDVLATKQPKGNYATESNISTSINTHDTATNSHNDIRLLIDGLTTRLNDWSNIDYDVTLAFDTSEVIFGATNTTSSVLGKAILGQMVLA
jgi:hypothetical protein